MKTEYIVSFAGAVICHALLLFGFKLEVAARPLPADQDASAVEVSLVAAPDESPPAETPPVETPPPVQDATPPPEPPQPPEPAQQPEVTMPPAPEPAPTAVPQTAPRPHSQPHPPSLAPKPAASHHGTNQRTAANGLADTVARYRSNPKPEYPPQARQLHQEGVVLLKVEVGVDGRPGEVSLIRGSGFPLLDQAAIRAVKQWTFEPASVASLPVPSAVDVPIRFSLSE